MIPVFSEDQIKEAFWKMFHKSGEHFYSYGDEESAEYCTSTGWDEFIYELEEIAKVRRSDGSGHLEPDSSARKE